MYGFRIQTLLLHNDSVAFKSSKIIMFMNLFCAIFPFIRAKYRYFSMLYLKLSVLFDFFDLTLSWRRSLSYRNHCRANNWTGFDMIRISVIKKLTRSDIIMEVPTSFWMKELVSSLHSSHWAHDLNSMYIKCSCDVFDTIWTTNEP